MSSSAEMLSAGEAGREGRSHRLLLSGSRLLPSSSEPNRLSIEFSKRWPHSIIISITPISITACSSSFYNTPGIEYYCSQNNAQQRQI